MIMALEATELWSVYFENWKLKSEANIMAVQISEASNGRTHFDTKS